MADDHDLALIRERIGEGLLDAEFGAFVRANAADKDEYAQAELAAFVVHITLCGVCHGEGHYKVECGGDFRMAPCGFCDHRGVVVKGGAS